MISLTALFWIFVVIFALVGAMRGWSKEILVTFTLVLSIFVIVVLLEFVPFMGEYMAQGGESRQVTVRAMILIVFAFFGYQTPKLQRISEVMVKEKLTDSLLGFIVGALNGYFLMGSLLYYLNLFNYPFSFLSAPPQDLTAFLIYMPPAFLAVPAIYFAVAVAFAFVVIVVI